MNVVDSGVMDGNAFFKIKVCRGDDKTFYGKLKEAFLLFWL